MKRHKAFFESLLIGGLCLDDAPVDLTHQVAAIDIFRKVSREDWGERMFKKVSGKIDKIFNFVKTLGKIFRYAKNGLNI